MTSISNVNSVALHVLQQASAVAEASGQQKPGSDSLVAIANGVSETIGVTKQPTQAQSKISEAMFSVTNVDINKLKLDLIDRTGKALGVDQADYTSRDEFVTAIKRAVGFLRMQGGPQAMIDLEKKLGLDELGVSIDDVISSANDPDSNDKLTKALEKQFGKDASDARQRLVRPDEADLYGTVNR